MINWIKNFIKKQIDLHAACMENMFMEHAWLVEYQKRKRNGTESGFISLERYKHVGIFNKEYEGD